MNNQAEIIEEVIAELNRARTKFPTWPDDPIHAAGVLLEESGELMKAVLEACYQKEPDGHYLQLIEVRNEAIQTAAMALRFLISMDQYTFEAGGQHKQGGDQTAVRVRCPACGDDRTGKGSLIYKGMVFCNDPCFIRWRKGAVEEAQI